MGQSTATVQLIQKVREHLAMPGQVSAAWASLRLSDRQMLLKLSGLLPSRGGQCFEQFNEIEQAAIRDAAKRARSWALKLEL